MKKLNWLSVITILFLVLVFGFIFSIINSFYGNPVSSAIATSKIRDYIEVAYPGMDLEITKAGYNFKFEEYVSHVQSSTSQDTRFSVSYAKGEITDEYEYRVVKRTTTHDRLQREFNDTLEKILKQEFPYESSMLFVDFGKDREDFKELSLDMPLDITNPPYPASLTIYLLTDEVSYQFLSDRLLELNDIMKKYKIPIAEYSVILQEPMPEGEKAVPGGKDLYLYDFPAQEINSENLIEVVKAHLMAWESEEDNKK